MYTNYTAPGIFAIGQNGFGAAAAEVTRNGQYSVAGASNPATPGDIPMLFVTGLGPVTPALPDGIPSSPTGQPLNVADSYNRSDLYVYIDGSPSPNIQYAGVVPGYAAGLYQINAQVPSGISTGADFLDILTPDAEAEQVTLNINAAGKAATATRAEAQRKPAGRGQRAVPRGQAIAPQVRRLRDR
jgi:uncharacterized protein (TIGR03437 family)